MNTKRLPLILRLVVCFIVSNGNSYSQCAVTTSTGMQCHPSFGSEVIVGPQNTFGATYSALTVSGKKVGSGQGNGGSVSLMLVQNGDPFRIIARKNDCIEISESTFSGLMLNIFPQTISQSGSICYGGGTTITLGGSQVNVNYNLYFNGSIAQTLQGTGAPISYTPVNLGGTYRIIATGPGCSQATSEIGAVLVGDGLNQNILPYADGFNPAANTIPGCWTQQFVSGANNLSFPTSSSNPTTISFEGSRYIFWNSNSPSNNAGNQTRLVSAPLSTSQLGAVDVEFYWYNNNNPAFSSGNYLNEGVQVQYSINGTIWFDAGPLISRHDASLPTGTGAWKLKTVRLPLPACRQEKIFIGLKFRSERGDNCSLDNLVVKASEGCVFDIASAPLIGEYQNINTYGTVNFSDFIGSYPYNSVGFSGGAESLFRFIPVSTGVYYVDGIAENSPTALFIKPASAGCSLFGWTGVNNNNMPGKRALGLLQAGVEYYILVDGAATFKVCKSQPSATVQNSCIDAIPFAGRIPNASTKKEYMLDANGNLIAELDFTSMGSTDVIKSSYYVNRGNVRRDNGNKEYLDRNFTVNIYGVGNIKIKLFFTGAELQRLIDEPNDGIADVNSISDIKLSRTSQTCGPVDAGGSATLITPTQSGLVGGDVYYIEFVENISGSGNRTYFLHGGNQPLNAQCQAPVSASFFPTNCQAASFSIPQSQSNATYSLYRKSDSLLLGTLQGNGGTINFGQVMSVSGTYFLKVDQAGCPTAIMAEQHYEIERPISQQVLLGGGVLCEGITERTLSLSGSEVGVTYTLYRNDVTTGILVQGSGSAIQIGKITQPGNYTVKGNRPSFYCAEAVVASLNVGSGLQFPFVESFNAENNLVSSTCWSTQFVNGGSEILLETQSPTPFANAVEGSRMVTWKSYDPTHPAGNESRLVSPPININFAGDVDLEFYWYNNNNPSYSSGNYLNEGVEIQYSLDGINWTSFGAFFARHDNTLQPGTGKWNKKRIAMPSQFGNRSTVYLGFKFRSEFGDNCNLDLVRLISNTGCLPVSGLDTVSTSSEKIKFQWTLTPGVTGYEYFVNNTAVAPTKGIPTTINTGAVSNLNAETNYFVHVRKECNPGLFSAWETISVITKPGPVNCDAAEVIYECTPVTLNISEGEGSWNFAGLYPLNSAGFPTPGRERIFKFTPTVSGVYYLDVISGGQYVDYFYKPASEGCGNTGWIGIDDFIGNWRKAIGFLQANKTYLILADNEETSATTQQFKICKATLIDPEIFNNCNGVYWFAGSIPANSPKEEYVIDDNGNLLAALDFSAVNNAVGDMTIFYRVNNNGIRRDAMNREYLDRDFRIYSTNQPSGLVKVKLFFTDDEFSRLANEPNDGVADVSSKSDINLSILDQDCSPTAVKQAMISAQTDGGTIFTIPYVQFNTPVLGAFYLHGGNEALNQPSGSNSVCAGATTSFVMKISGTNNTYQWEVDSGSGYTPISNNQIYAGTNSNTLFIISPPSNFNDYKYRCVVSSLSGIIIGSPQTLKTVSTWKGNHAFWEDPSNWSCGVVPDENTNVVIPAGVTTMPHLSSNTVVRSITIQSGASLTVEPGFKLDIKGK